MYINSDYVYIGNHTQDTVILCYMWAGVAGGCAGRGYRLHTGGYR